LARQLAERMGFRLPKRLRTSKLVGMSEVLEVEKGPLARGAIYDIIDKVYPDGDLSQDLHQKKQQSSEKLSLLRPQVLSKDAVPNLPRSPIIACEAIALDSSSQNCVLASFPGYGIVGNQPLDPSFD